MILTPDELKALTGKTRPSWQAKELDFLGVPYRRRSDGSLLVLWSDAGAKQNAPLATDKRAPKLRMP